MNTTMKKMIKSFAVFAAAAMFGLTALATNVAKIGDTEYATLQAAFAAATNGCTVSLLADIDLGGADWTAVTFNHKTFDGNGHKVSNFTATSANGKMVGFFGNAGQSTIKNLTIENATVNGINHVGAIAGYGICTDIENCKAINCTITTSVANNDDGDKAGGIIGYLPGEPNASVRNCSVEGCTIKGYRDCGGIVGYANSYNSGEATISGNTVKNTVILNDRSNNYKNYTADADFDMGEILGDNGHGTDYKVAVISGCTATKVTTAVYTDGFLPGTDGIWHITNLNGLKAFRDSVNSGKSYAGVTIQLDADIDLGNEEWTPIAGQNETVIFNGNGHTISNLKITDPSESDLGLFEQAVSWTIKDLTIDGATISGKGRVAAIVGQGICAHVEGCTVLNATVTTAVYNNDDGDKAGAVVGYLSGESTAWVKDCVISNCTIKGYRDCGGAVGYANGKASVTGTTVKNTVVLNDRSNNYKGYTTDEQFDIHEVVGEAVSTATVSGNTHTKVATAVYTDGFLPGTDGIWHITNLNGLKAFRDSVNAGKSYAGAMIQLDADIDLGNEEWSPIAGQNESVVFDGNDHTISNLRVTDETKSDVGLFAWATSWTLKDLTIDGAIIMGKGRVAALVGQGLCTYVEGCTVKNATVTAKVYNDDDGDKAGAICGYLTAQPNAWVKNCRVENCTVTGYRDVGGAVGYSQNAILSGTTVKDTDIYNDQSNNYKGYKTQSEFDVHEVVGHIDGEGVAGNTADNVTIHLPAVQIGDKKYMTLAAAIAAVANGETITLLANNSEAITATTTVLFVIDPNGCAFDASNVDPLDGCELVQNLDNTYTYRMKVEMKDQVTKNVVETKIEDEVEVAAVAITDDKFEQIFKESGSKELEVIASGVGTVSFNSVAVDKIGANMEEAIEAAGGKAEGATAKTTLTVAIADVKEERPTVIVTEQKTLEVVQAISVTAVMKTIIQQSGAETTTITNEEVYAAAKAAGISTVTIPYSGISPQVWFIDTSVTPWATNEMTSAYSADSKLLSFAVAHFSDYVITDAETYAMVGAEKFRTLQEAFDWVSSNQTQGVVVTLTKTNTLTTAAALAADTTAALNLNGKAVIGSIAVGAGSILTVTNGTVDAGSAVFASGASDAKIYLVDGIYKGAFPDSTGLATNAGPILVSGGKFTQQVPWAFCAPGYEPNPTATEGYYTVKNAKIYIRDIGAIQRYPWNGYVDITLDVCWDTANKAKLYVTAWDVSSATPTQITMTTATLIEEGVAGSRTVNCATGFDVTAPAKKTLHLIWNSVEGVPQGTKKDKVGFKFLAK